jgi:hypothetical protein
MAVDHEGTDDGSGSEDVPETKITLIGEADLESTDLSSVRASVAF